MANLDLEGHGSLGQGRHGRDSQGSSRSGLAAPGPAGNGSQAVVRKGVVRTGRARVGTETNGSLGLASQGAQRKGTDSPGLAVGQRQGSEGKGGEGQREAVGEGNGSSWTRGIRPGAAKQANSKGAKAPPADFSVRESHVNPKKADRLRPVMSRLASEGRGTAKELVREAEPENSPIHDCFDWDADEAAAKWRLHQATNYWGSIRIDIQSTGGPIRAPAFIPIVVNDEQSYRPIGEVAANPNWRDQMMGQATRELESWQKRYDALATVAQMRPVFDAIANVTRREVS